MKKHTYDFVSRWHIVGSAHEIDQAIHDVEDWPQWWPGLESVEIFRLTEDSVGSQAAMHWRAPLGYRLHINVTITDYKPSEFIAFAANGDLDGTGRWEFDRIDGATNMTIIWKVTTTKPWMNRFAWVLRPVFSLAHSVLMRRGKHGLQKYMATRDEA